MPDTRSREFQERTKNEYERIDRQIKDTAEWIQRRLMGFGTEERDRELEADNGYLAEIRARFYDDPVLLAAYIMPRLSQNDPRFRELVLDRDVPDQSGPGLSYGFRQELVCA